MADVQFGAQVSAYLTSWDEIRAVAQTMDAGRYDSIWFADHFVPPNRGKEVEDREAFEAFSLAAAVGVATETLRIGHLVL
ncbi:MAG: LLM class flavin-dependent oxidoreductase, partial [Chloroflexi bacterium]|nr:LLM class flavin-dependent oxidoreductase [Chloroflexota bacterium]